MSDSGVEQSDIVLKQSGQVIHSIKGDIKLPQLNKLKVPVAEIVTPIPEPLSGAETAELVKEIYHIAGPRLGPRLVEANIVLTLAGARGQTEFFIANPQAADRETIIALNNVLEPRGIRISDIGKSFGKGDEVINIDNLRGYERVSRLTKIPGVEPYNFTSGWKGLDEWQRDVFFNVKQATEEGGISSDNTKLTMITEGIYRGYPDKAIYDFIEWVVNKQRSPGLTEAKILYTHNYSGVTPAFDYFSDHANESSIVETERSWSKILKDFYSHPWHQQIKQDSQFIATRRLVDKREL